MPQFLVSGLFESFLLLMSGENNNYNNNNGGHHHRQLQPQFPDYTSPPLPMALEATPEDFRSDAIIDEMRAVAGAGNCSFTDNACHIPFPVPDGAFEGDNSKIGVVLYGGGLVDPRGYSVMAQLLATRYGFPTVVPVFAGDLAFVVGNCDSGRLDIAKAEFPEVEKWVLAGHSFGGIGAMTDMWERWNAGDESAAGLVMLAADLRNDIECGAVDYSSTNLPMASVTASLDGVLNATRWEANKIYLSNATELVNIYGGNHGYFGAYDSSARFEVLGQTDGEALIPRQVQWDFVASAIASVAARTGAPMPVRNMEGPAEIPATDDAIGGDRPRCPPDLETDEASSGNRMTMIAGSIVATATLFVALL